MIVSVVVEIVDVGVDVIEVVIIVISLLTWTLSLIGLARLVTFGLGTRLRLQCLGGAGRRRLGQYHGRSWIRRRSRVPERSAHEVSTDDDCRHEDPEYLPHHVHGASLPPSRQNGMSRR